MTDFFLRQLAKWASFPSYSQMWCSICSVFLGQCCSLLLLLCGWRLYMSYMLSYVSRLFWNIICPGQEGDGAQEPKWNVDTQVVLWWVRKLPGGIDASKKWRQPREIASTFLLRQIMKCIWAMKHFGYLGCLGDNNNLLFGNYTCWLAIFKVPLNSKPTSKIKYHKCHVFISSSWAVTQDKVKLKAFLVEDVQSQRSFVP